MYLIHFISFWIWNSLPWILPSRKYWTLISVFTICRSLLAARDAWMTAVNRMSVWTIFARGFLIWRPEVKCRFETAPNRMTTPTCPDFTEVIHMKTKVVKKVSPRKVITLQQPSKLVFSKKNVYFQFDGQIEILIWSQTLSGLIIFFRADSNFRWKYFLHN